MPGLKRALILNLVLMFATSCSAMAGPKRYVIEPTHTEVVFTWTHFGFSRPTGKVANPTGFLMLDESNPANSMVNVSFQVANLSTEVPILDERLKSNLFFDAAKYPLATFKSTKVTLTGTNTANVLGNLTLHGVTRPIVLAVKLNKIGLNMELVKTAGFSATGKILRSQFGIAAAVPMVSDEIDLAITAEANAD